MLRFRDRDLCWRCGCADGRERDERRYQYHVGRTPVLPFDATVTEQGVGGWKFAAGTSSPAAQNPKLTDYLRKNVSAKDPRSVRTTAPVLTLWR